MCIFETFVSKILTLGRKNKRIFFVLLSLIRIFALEIIKYGRKEIFRP